MMSDSYSLPHHAQCQLGLPLIGFIAGRRAAETVTGLCFDVADELTLPPKCHQFAGADRILPDAVQRSVKSDLDFLAIRRARCPT